MSSMLQEPRIMQMTLMVGIPLKGLKVTPDVAHCAKALTVFKSMSWIIP